MILNTIDITDKWAQTPRGNDHTISSTIFKVQTGDYRQYVLLDWGGINSRGTNETLSEIKVLIAKLRPDPEFRWNLMLLSLQVNNFDASNQWVRVTQTETSESSKYSSTFILYKCIRTRRYPILSYLTPYFDNYNLTVWKWGIVKHK